MKTNAAPQGREVKAPAKKAGAGKQLAGKRLRFAQEYVVDQNGTAAYRRAGYNGNDGVCASEAYKLLRNPYVKAEIDRLLAGQAERIGITGDQVLRDIVRLSGKAEARDDIGNALRGKEMLGKHFKLFTEKHEVVGRVIFEDHSRYD